MLRNLAGLLLAALTPLASPAFAGRIVVPDDQPTLKAAVIAASAGDVIVVRTSVPQFGVTIDKPLTILGDPLALVFAGTFWPVPCTDSAAFELSGPGFGTVTLVNVYVVSIGDCFHPPAGIEGGGFEELHIHGSHIEGGRAGASGTGHGTPGIAVDVPVILLVRSQVFGHNPDSEYCAGRLPDDPEAGIDAPSSTVVVIDSLVVGGGLGNLCCAFCICPPSLSGLGGHGGPGIRCDKLFQANSSVSGGAGAIFVAYPGAELAGSGVPCGQLPGGAPFTANVHVPLPNDAWGSGPLRMGATWVLSWNTPGALAALYASFQPAGPILVQGVGWLFAAPGSAFFVAPVPGGQTFSLPIAVPARPSLLGLEVVFQLVDPSSGLTRPVLGALVP